MYGMRSHATVININIDVGSDNYTDLKVGVCVGGGGGMVESGRVTSQPVVYVLIYSNQLPGQAKKCEGADYTQTSD